MKIAGLLAPAVPPKSARAAAPPERSFEDLLARRGPADGRAASAPAKPEEPQVSGTRPPTSTPETQRPAPGEAAAEASPSADTVRENAGRDARPADLQETAEATTTAAPPPAAPATGDIQDLRPSSDADGGAPRRAFGFSELGLAGLSSPTAADAPSVAAGATAPGAPGPDEGSERPQGPDRPESVAVIARAAALIAAKGGSDPALAGGASLQLTGVEEARASPFGELVVSGTTVVDDAGFGPSAGAAPARSLWRAPARPAGQRLLLIEQDGAAHLIIRSGALGAADEEQVQQRTRAALEDFGLRPGSLRLNGKPIDKTGSAPGRRHHGD